MGAISNWKQGVRNGGAGEVVLHLGYNLLFVGTSLVYTGPAYSPMSECAFIIPFCQ